jgi:PilZ domain
VTLQPHQSPRAPRFAIPIAIRYRTPADATWLEGWTENISKSGVLFRADREIELGTPVEMMMEIPTWIATPVAGATLCRGRIVRAVPPRRSKIVPRSPQRSSNTSSRVRPIRAVSRL